MNTKTVCSENLWSIYAKTHFSKTTDRIQNGQYGLTILLVSDLSKYVKDWGMNESLLCVAWVISGIPSGFDDCWCPGSFCYQESNRISATCAIFFCGGIIQNGITHLWSLKNSACEWLGAKGLNSSQSSVELCYISFAVTWGLFYLHALAYNSMDM